MIESVAWNCTVLRTPSMGVCARVKGRSMVSLAPRSSVTWLSCGGGEDVGPAETHLLGSFRRRQKLRLRSPEKVGQRLQGYDPSEHCYFSARTLTNSYLNVRASLPSPGKNGDAVGEEYILTPFPLLQLVPRNGTRGSDRCVARAP